MNHTDPTADAHVAEARRAVHESLILLPAWEADRVRALVADLETAVEGRAAMRAAAPAVVSPPTTPTADPERGQVLDALDAPYCQTLGYLTPDDLLKAYDDSRAAVVAAPTNRAAAPTDWIDGHPQLEAIAAAVWEQCEHHDSGLIIDDPRNIAVAALAAVLPEPTGQAAVRVAALREGADAIAQHPGPIPWLPGLPHGEGDGFWWDTRDRDAAAALLRRLAAEASPPNRRAFVHNAITDALSAAGDWVPLSVRIAATRAALAEVDAWHAAEPAPAEEQPAAADDEEA